MQLAPGAFIARIDDCSVILDVDRDKYILLGSRLSELALMSATDRTGFDDRQTALGELVAKGVLPAFPQTPIGSGPSREASPAEETALATGRFGLGLTRCATLTGSAVMALRDVNRSLKVRRFRDTIAFLRYAKSRRRMTRAHFEQQDLLDSFLAARPWFPVQPICRLDAPALALHFWRRGLDADLVFGVRLNPFGAHCWAQCGGTALNEPHEKLRQYTVIMTV